MNFLDFVKHLGLPAHKMKIYRHSGKGPNNEWERGPEWFLSYVTYQNKQTHVFSEGVEYCAHFIAEEDEEKKPLGRFVGITEVTGQTTDAFDQIEPASGDVEGYIIGSVYPKSGNEIRVFTPQKWLEDERLKPFVGELKILWQKDAVRANVQWVLGTPKAILAFDDEISPEDVEGGIDQYEKYETRVLKAHRAWERRGGSTLFVKEIRGLTCEGCGLDAEAHFGREIAMSCIEAHHLKPVAEMPAEGRIINPHDFAVLCATCHRIIHRLESPNDLEGLRTVVRDVRKLHTLFSKNKSG